MTRISLCEDWRFRKLPELTMEQCAPDTLPEDGWETVTLPHTWYTDDDQYRGLTAYRRTLRWEEGLTRAFLSFEGADQRCRVWADGKLLGEHRGGYSRFRYLVERPVDGVTELCVLLDNRLDETISPHFGDFTVFGGLYRPVELIGVGETSFDYGYYGTDGLILRASLDEQDAPSAEGVDFLIAEALREDPRPLYVTCQGALTDVAAALNRCPAIASKLTVVWIGGFPYPYGGPEFNLMQDAAAARAVLASEAAVWQLPVNVYSTMEVTLAELAARVRPCGAVGKYLYEQLEEYNLQSRELPGLRRGENWCLGDSPVLGALLQCAWRGNFHTETAPLIADDLRYLPNPGGKEIRVYDSVDVRFILEDMYAKLALCAR